MSDKISAKHAARLLAGGDLTWVCTACGKSGTSRETVGDESCYLHAVLVWTASIFMGMPGRVTKATGVEVE